MRYLALIYGNEAEAAKMTQAEQEAEFNAYGEFAQAAGESGVLLGGEALHPTSAATTIRVQNGKVLTTDGPFAETKEQLGGYYLIKTDNLDEAIKVASQIPGAKVGSIEIRPVMEWE
ncbi:YciI family protein [Tengunoibacter tsumagoiensis]|uniref:YCII-related domain-containing protein n=1 Tax=Tengunoibacter tsumagoiensis TaxID=2014871 RepID=A0A402A3I2_9CHLR|nr:YciI family protein [Tengunoibacter tsumagoiensis]GCE13718.1 hypothetical protein KTT_35770 [Tengunoibacter tsumagoiensis]